MSWGEACLWHRPVSSAHHSRSTDWCQDFDGKTDFFTVLASWTYSHCMSVGFLRNWNRMSSDKESTAGLKDSCTMSHWPYCIQTSGLCHPLPITVPPSEFIQTWSQSNNKTTKMLFLFLHSNFPCFSSTNKLLKGASHFLSTTLFPPRSLRQQRFIFERDISTLTGGRRGGTFVTLLLSLVIFCCGGSQMVWFSAHMVLFLRDHCSWPAWLKKMKKNEAKLRPKNI